MSQVCRICSHPKRIEIDRLLVSGGNMSKIARDFEVSAGSLWNHKTKHLTRQLLKHAELREILSGRHLLETVQDLLSACQEILDKTRNNPKKYGVALQAVRECRETVRLLWDVAIKLEEFKSEQKKPENDSAHIYWKETLSNLSVEELETLKALIMKGEGKQPGRRTDLEPKKPGPKKGWNHPQAMRIEPQKFAKRRRRRKEPDTEAEFDQIRSKVGLKNYPEPERPSGDLGW